MSKEEKSTSGYAVNIMRNDGQHITAFEADSYDSCYEKWEELTQKWEDSVKQEIPFKLKEPMVTAFHPVLIKEITLVPVVEQQPTSKNHNPYQKEMVANGLSSTLNKYRGPAVEAVHPHLQDQGYK